MDERMDILRKYNLWTEGDFDFGFMRVAYTGRIMDYVGNRLVKVLIGQRRTGKSYVLRQIARELIRNGVPPQNTLFINRELSDFAFLKTHKDLEELVALYKSELHPQGRMYIFIDEVQLIEEWEKSVNSYSQDYTEEYELFISGSNSRMLSGELATLLSGRYVQFPIYPFSYQEYTEIRHLEQNRESYMGYMNTGGIPELFVLPEKQEVQRNYLSALKDTILLKDIIQRYSIRDPRLLEDLFAFLVGNASNLVSIGNIVNYFKSQGRKTSYDAVAAYIGYIEDSWRIVVNALTCAERKYCPVRRNITSTTLPLRISSIPEQPMVWVINWRILSIWSYSGQAMMSIPDVPKRRKWISWHGKATARFICNPLICWLTSRRCVVSMLRWSRYKIIMRNWLFRLMISVCHPMKEYGMCGRGNCMGCCKRC